jgi:DNA-nicking Smr family endonuclease
MAMDFGEILDRWEREQGIYWENRRKEKGRGNRAGKGKEGEKKKKESPREAGKSPVPPDASRFLSLWLETHETYDKDAEEPAAPERGAAKRRRLLARRPDAVIDLHGLTRDQAWTALEDFFENGRRRGFSKLAVIHGKGNHSPGEAVLKRTAREFIERCPFAGESGQGPSGGSGVTWVVLK